MLLDLFGLGYTGVTPTPVGYVTAYDIISRALKALGHLGAGETLRTDDARDGLERLNELVESWATQRYTMASLLRTIVDLTSGTATYTIGSGGDINIDRPTEIHAAGLILDSTLDTPLEVPIGVLLDQWWIRITQKTLTGSQLEAIYYNLGWSSGLGQISVFPIPTTDTQQLVLYTPQAVGTFAGLQTQYSFASGVVGALRLELARMLAPEFGRPWTQDLEDQRRETVANFKRTNMRPRVLTNAFAPCGGAYDIRTDS